MLRKTFVLGLGLGLALVLGCGQGPPTTAKATLVNPQGQKVGEATLTQTPEGVKIVMKERICLPESTRSTSMRKASARVRIFRAPAATLIPLASITA